MCEMKHPLVFPAFCDLSVVTGLSPGNWQTSSEINVVFIHIERLSEKVYGRMTFSAKLDMESHRLLPVMELR